MLVTKVCTPKWLQHVGTAPHIHADRHTWQGNAQHTHELIMSPNTFFQILYSHCQCCCSLLPLIKDSAESAQKVGSGLISTRYFIQGVKHYQGIRPCCHETPPLQEPPPRIILCCELHRCSLRLNLKSCSDFDKLLRWATSQEFFHMWTEA